MFQTNKNVMALYLTTAVAVASQPALAAMFNPDTAGTAGQSQKISFGNSMVDAADQGNKTLIKALLDTGENVDQRGELETTALLRAAYRGNSDVVKMLLLAGANPNLSDIGGATALHIASREGHKQVVDLLLRSGATVNIADSEGFTPLMRATMRGQDKVFEDLVALGADTDTKNNFGKTAVEYAAQTKNKDLVNKFLAIDEQKQLPLQVADISGKKTGPEQARIEENTLEQISELSPASSWKEAVSSQLFGNDYMLTSVADSKAATGSTFNMLDFGSFGTEEDAKKKLEELKSKHADTLKGLNVVVVEKNSGSNTVYHINAGLLDTKEQAVERCKALVGKGVICRPVETKMMLSQLTKPAAPEAPAPAVEAAPAPVVEKAELPALEKFHAAKKEPAKAEVKAEIKAEEKQVAKVEEKIEVKAPALAIDAKPAEDKKPVDTSKLPIIVKDEPKKEFAAIAAAPAAKVEAPKAEVKTESNIGSFNLSKNEEQETSETESFFGSFFGSSEKEEKVAEVPSPLLAPKAVASAPVLPEIKAAPKAELKPAPEKLEVIAAAPAPAKAPASVAVPVQSHASNPLLAVKDAPKAAARPEAPKTPIIAEVKEAPAKEIAANEAPVRINVADEKKELTKEDVRKLPKIVTSDQQLKELPKLETAKEEPAPAPLKITQKAEAPAPVKPVIKDAEEKKPVDTSKLPILAVKEEPKKEVAKPEIAKQEVAIKLPEAPKVEVKPERKIEAKASDALKPLPQLKSEVATKPLPRETFNSASLEEPRIAVPPLNTPAARPALTAQNPVPAPVMPKVTTAAPVAQVAPLQAPAQIAVPAAPVYVPQQVAVAPVAPVVPVIAPAFQPAPVAQPAPQAYVAPAQTAPIQYTPVQQVQAQQAPVTAAPLVASNTVVVSKRQPQQTATFQPAPAPVQQQAYVAPAPQPVVPQQTAYAAPAQPVAAPYVNPAQVVVSRASAAPAPYNPYAAPAAVAQPAPVAVAPAPAPIAQAPAAQAQIVPAPIAAAPVATATTALKAPAQPGYIDIPAAKTNPLVANNITQQHAAPYHIQPQYVPAPSAFAPQPAQVAEARPAGNEMWVNVGYFTTQNAARGFWNRISASNSATLPKFRMKTKSPLGGSGRVTAEIGPVYSNSDANNICNIVSAEGLSCDVTTPLRRAESTDRYGRFISGQRHSELNTASGDYGVVGEEVASGSYNSWSLQLGTFESKDAARNTWEALKDQNRLLRGMEPNINGSESNSRLRLRAGKFTSTEAAQNACEELRRNFVSCIIVRSS